MATTKTKEQLVRLSWLTELRRQGDRQCCGTYTHGRLVCALGLLREAAFPGATWDITNGDAVEDVGRLAGLYSNQSFDVAHRNDGDQGYRKHTFAEIADVVASWFPGA
jgi:hypothetical protein